MANNFDGDTQKTMTMMTLSLEKNCMAHQDGLMMTAQKCHSYMVVSNKFLPPASLIDTCQQTY